MAKGGRSHGGSKSSSTPRRIKTVEERTVIVKTIQASSLKESAGSVFGVWLLLSLLATFFWDYPAEWAFGKPKGAKS